MQPLDLTAEDLQYVFCDPDLDEDYKIRVLLKNEPERIIIKDTSSHPCHDMFKLKYYLEEEKVKMEYPEGRPSDGSGLCYQSDPAN